MHFAPIINLLCRSICNRLLEPGFIWINSSEPDACLIGFRTYPLYLL
jgi:hypothetical protein